jgi:hypothetical protein
MGSFTHRVKASFSGKTAKTSAVTPSAFPPTGHRPVSGSGAPTREPLVELNGGDELAAAAHQQVGIGRIGPAIPTALDAA